MILKNGGRVGPDNTITIRLADGPKAQNIVMPLEDSSAQMLLALANDAPVLLGAFLSQGPYDPGAPWPSEPAFVFRGQLVLVKDPLADPQSPSWRDEVLLRVKKFVLVRERELAALRRDVATLESVSDSESPTREPIPRDVRLVVFERDNGRCVTCGATRDLQFDHIIPVAKGGASTAANIQILCQRCNLAKGDRI